MALIIIVFLFAVFMQTYACVCMFIAYLCLCMCFLIDFECSEDENYVAFILVSFVPISMSGT